MSEELLTRLEIEDLKENLREVQDLLHRHALVEHLVGRQEMPRHALVEQLVHKQHLAELRAKLDKLHPADIAYILEALPLEERLVVWDLVKADRDGDILLEVSDAVRESLIASMDAGELVAAAETLEADELADLAPDLPAEVIQEVVQSLPVEERERLRSALSYAEGTVGALMDFEMVTVREDVTLEAVTRYLRRMDELPDHTDQLYVVDRERRLHGTLPLARLIVSDLEAEVATVMVPERVTLHPEDRAEDAAQAFERYDLISAPVVDAHDRLVARLTVDAVVDYIREASAESQLAEAGLREEEDIFAPVLDSFRNRWSWLAVNLVTAFIASRVIDAFEGSIAKLVALAALMPIVAGIGGNSGNQTITMIVRALALGQIQSQYWSTLLLKELSVALLNGVVWGTLLGVIALALYGNVALGGVMALAMLLNLILAALMGVAIPWLRARLGKDPAVGSSVLITACTDSGGFFIFLGLATLFLV
jgi:magnesium transporter